MTCIASNSTRSQPRKKCIDACEGAQCTIIYCENCSTSSGVSSCSSPEGPTGVPCFQNGRPKSQCDKPTTMTRHRHNSRATTRQHVPRDCLRDHRPKVQHTSIDVRDPNWPPISDRLSHKRTQIKVIVKVTEESEECLLRQLYVPFINVILSESDVLHFIKDDVVHNAKSSVRLSNRRRNTQLEDHLGGVRAMPPLSMILLLQDSDIMGGDRVRSVEKFLRRQPWKFHHTECIPTHGMKAYPENSLDYFCLTDSLPVCSVRQAHSGQECLRILRYVTHSNWDANYQLYKLIIDQDPSYRKSDFCVFDLHTNQHRTIQYAMKRLPPGVDIIQPCQAVIGFQVQNLAVLLPILKSTRKVVNERGWKVTDADGNDIYLEQTQQARLDKKPRSRSHCRSRSSHSARSTVNLSSPPAETFASVLLDTAREFLEADVGSVSCDPKSDADQPLTGPKWTSLGSISLAHSQQLDQFVSPNNPGHAHSPNRYSRVQEYVDAEARSRGLDTRHHNGYNWHQHTDSGYAEDKSDESDIRQTTRSLPTFNRGSKSDGVVHRKTDSLLSDDSEVIQHITSSILKNFAINDEIKPGVGLQTKSLGCVPHDTCSGAFSPYDRDHVTTSTPRRSVAGTDVRNIRATPGIPTIVPVPEYNRLVTAPQLTDADQCDTLIPMSTKQKDNRYFPELGVGECLHYNKHVDMNTSDYATYFALNMNKPLERNQDVPQKCAPCESDSNHTLHSPHAKIDAVVSSLTDPSFDEAPIDCPNEIPIICGYASSTNNTDTNSTRDGISEHHTDSDRSPAGQGETLQESVRVRHKANVIVTDSQKQALYDGHHHNASKSKPSILKVRATAKCVKFAVDMEDITDPVPVDSEVYRTASEAINGFWI